MSAFSRYPWCWWRELRERRAGSWKKDQATKAISHLGGFRLSGTWFLHQKNGIISSWIWYAMRKKYQNCLIYLLIWHLANYWAENADSVRDIVDVIPSVLVMTWGWPPVPLWILTLFSKALLNQDIKILCDYVKKNSTHEDFLHSCGSITITSRSDLKPVSIS